MPLCCQPLNVFFFHCCQKVSPTIPFIFSHAQPTDWIVVSSQELNQFLISAAERGNVKLVQQALESKADLMAIDEVWNQCQFCSRAFLLPSYVYSLPCCCKCVAPAWHGIDTELCNVKRTLKQALKQVLSGVTCHGPEQHSKMTILSVECMETFIEIVLADSHKDTPVVVSWHAKYTLK